MYHNPFSSQTSNKPKLRNAYEVRRVDMSQFLPELKAPPQDSKNTITNSKSSRSRSLNCNYRIRKVPQIQHPFKINNKPPEVDNLILSSKRNVASKPSVTNNNKYPPAKPPRNSSHLTMAYSSHSIPIRENFVTEGSDSDAREPHYTENFVPNYQKNQGKFVGAAVQEHNKQIVNSKDPGLTQKEIHEYKFLEKAQVLHIAEENESEFRSLNDTSVNHSKHEFITQAIEDIVAKHMEENFQASLITRELDIVLSCSLQELKNSVDFTELWSPFLDLVGDSTVDIHKKMNMLSFLFYFCEESLFHLTLDFEKIYEGITKFILEVYCNNKERNLFYAVSKAYAELHKYFLQNLDVMDRAKLTMIFQNFLNVFTANVSAPEQWEVFEESLFSKKEEAIPFLVLSSEFALITRKFLRKIEIRNVVSGEDTIKSKMTELINFLSYFTLRKWDSEKLVFPNKVSKTRQSLLVSVNNFGICLNMFKYAEIVNSSANEASGMKSSVEECIAKILNSVGDLIACREMLPYLFGATEENDNKEGVKEITESLCNLVSSLKEIATNQKLYEPNGLDFNRILEGVKQLHEKLQEVSKQMSQEFSNLVEDLLNKPLEKLQRTIIKNIESFRS